MGVYRIDYKLPLMDCVANMLSKEDDVQDYVNSIKRLGGSVVEISQYK